jgi:hypothetical protein
MVIPLEEKFEARGMRRGGILFLPASDAIGLIEAARAQGRPVLGIDSFHITDTTTEPLMEHSIDLSVGEISGDTWSAASEFVRARSESGFMFEVVL